MLCEVTRSPGMREAQGFRYVSEEVDKTATVSSTLKERRDRQTGRCSASKGLVSSEHGPATLRLQLRMKAQHCSRYHCEKDYVGILHRIKEYWGLSCTHQAFAVVMSSHLSPPPPNWAVTYFLFKSPYLFPPLPIPCFLLQGPSPSGWIPLRCQWFSELN